MGLCLSLHIHIHNCQSERNRKGHIDTGREPFSIGRIANKYTLGAAYDKAEKIQYELIRTIITAGMNQMRKSIDKEKKKC